jgi:Uma2 family endonuclease
MMREAEYHVRKLRRVEYDRLVACELLGPEDRIELLDGQMVLKEPQYSPHATGVDLVAHALRSAFGTGFHVRVQAPVALDDESEPEPDLSVVPGEPRDYLDEHPARPVLVVEVALTRVRFDRSRKGSLYARAGLPEYWIVNIPDGWLEVYREPRPDASAVFGWRYGSIDTLCPERRIAPLSVPAAPVLVADLLP